MKTLPTPSAKRRRVARIARRAALFGGAASLLLAFVLWSSAYWMPLPDELFRPADRTVTLLDRGGHEIAVVPSDHARVAEAVALTEMGARLPRITVALEDRRFWTHDGVDFRAVGAAFWRNARSARVVSGGSTIAQQLIKNTRGRSGWRGWDKLCEALAARRLVRLWPKERILEEYLNRIDYGNRRLGPRAAARAYFGKEPADLTLAEAIYLAGLPQAPTRCNPWSRPAQAEERYRRSVRVLAAAGVVDATAARELALAPPPVLRRVPPNEAAHFVDAIVSRSPRLRGRVKTTLDLELQRAVTSLAHDHVARLSGRGVSQAAVVVLDNRDGGVRALVGSADPAARGGQINGALLPRSAGSVLKPFLYLDAIEQRRLTAASVLPDTPDAIHSAYVDYDPQNFDQRFLGPVRVREALGNSLNVPAVYALSLVGARPFFSHLTEWGFRFPRDLRDYGAGLILGNAEPRLIDLAAAFAGIAAGGRVPAWRLLETDPCASRVVASPESAAIMADMLCDDDARRRAFGRDSALAFSVRVPCKTGTSSGFRDAWTVGSTAQHTVAVWAGNFDSRPMDAASSIEAAAPLWRAVMEILLRTDDGVPAPVASDRLVAREICRLTGRIPTAESPGIVREWFLAGTEPVENASVWLRPASSGDAHIVLPPEYAAWCRSPHNFLGAVADSPRTITIRSPAENGAYVLDPNLPAGQQQLRLEAAIPACAASNWTIDGHRIDPVDGVWLWPIAVGPHLAEVSSGTLRAQVHFVVQP